MILGGVICGIEHSGTSMLLDMLKAHPWVYARFEFGLMLSKKFTAESIQGCKPFFEANMAEHDLGKGSRDYILRAESWLDLYSRFFERVQYKDVEARKRHFFIDKCPAYIRNLDLVSSRIGNVPIIRLKRDPRAVLYSFCKRGLASQDKVLPEFLARYRDSYRYLLGPSASNKYNTMDVQYEELINEPRRVIREVCSFYRIPFYEKMLVPENSFSLLENCYSGKIENFRITEYEDFLSKEILQGLEKSLRDLWHLVAYEPKN